MGMIDYTRVTSWVKSLKGIKSASPFIEKQVMLSSQTKVTGVIIRGVNPDSAGEYIQAQMVAGDLALMGDRSKEDYPTEGQRLGGIVLGKGLADSLGVLPGDKLRVISPSGTPTPMGIIPRMKNFRVAGVFHTGTGYDAGLAYISLSRAQSFFRMEGRTDGVQVRVENIMKAAESGELIKEQLGASYWVGTWKEANKALFAALRWEKTAMFIILALMVLVAAFSIVSTLVMVVMKKNKDIAILKSLGVDKKSIIRIFTIQGMVIGVLGTGIGAATGLIIGKIQQTYHVIKLDSGVYGLDILPIKIEYWWGFAFVCIMAVVLTFLATLYPSRMAAAVPPVEGLRYE
jgi:lipoprotein-releasing system permease protein